MWRAAAANLAAVTSEPPPWFGQQAADRFQRLFLDLEHEIAAADAADHAAEIADRSRGEYGQLRIVDRARASIDGPVTITVTDAGTAVGRLCDVGADCLMVAERGRFATLVPLSAVAVIDGLVPDSMSPGSEGRIAGSLGLRSALRSLARDRLTVVITVVGGDTLAGTLDRVGADFVELAEHPPGEWRRVRSVGRVRTIAIHAIRLVRPASHT